MGKVQLQIVHFRLKNLPSREKIFRQTKLGRKGAQLPFPSELPPPSDHGHNATLPSACIHGLPDTVDKSSRVSHAAFNISLAGGHI